MAGNEYKGHATRNGNKYTVTFTALGVDFGFEADAMEGPDTCLPESSPVVVRLSSARWRPTLVLLPMSETAIASAPATRIFSATKGIDP